MQKKKYSVCGGTTSNPESGSSKLNSQTLFIASSSPFPLLQSADVQEETTKAERQTGKSRNRLRLLTSAPHPLTVLDSISSPSSWWGRQRGRDFKPHRDAGKHTRNKRQREKGDPSLLLKMNQIFKHQRLAQQGLTVLTAVKQRFNDLTRMQRNVWVCMSVCVSCYQRHNKECSCLMYSLKHAHGFKTHFHLWSFFRLVCVSVCAHVNVCVSCSEETLPSPL